MAGTPHNKLPADVHKQRGTWRADRHGHTKGKLKGKEVKKTVTPPKHFTLNAKEKSVFKATVKLLHEHKLVSALDLDAICVYSQSVIQWQHFWKDLQDQGHVIYAEETAKVNPAGALMHAAFQRMVKFQDQFGMNQLSRQKIEDTGWDETEAKDENGKSLRVIHPNAAVQTRKTRR